jgi:hypothetical protein
MIRVWTVGPHWATGTQLQAQSLSLNLEAAGPGTRSPGAHHPTVPVASPKPEAGELADQGSASQRVSAADVATSVAATVGPRARDGRALTIVTTVTLASCFTGHCG